MSEHGKHTKNFDYFDVDKGLRRQSKYVMSVVYFKHNHVYFFTRQSANNILKLLVVYPNNVVVMICFPKLKECYRNPPHVRCGQENRIALHHSMCLTWLRGSDAILWNEYFLSLPIQCIP